jgi:hypothetical protein
MELKMTNGLAKALKEIKRIEKLIGQIERLTKQTYGNAFNKTQLKKEFVLKQGYKYSEMDLDKLDVMINEKYISKSEKYIETTKENIDKNEKKIKYLEKLHEKIQTKYNEAITKDNQFKYIDQLIDLLEKTIGEELSKTHQYLRDNE